MRLKKRFMIVVLIVIAINIVISNTHSTFAQCPQGYSYCTTFSGWCCLEENYCVDPSPPYCQPFGEPSSTSSISTTTTSIATISITSTSSSILPTSSSSSSSTSAPPTTAPSTTTSSGVGCGAGEIACQYFTAQGVQYQCCDGRFYECCDGGCCSFWEGCPLVQIYGEYSAEAELLRKYRDGILSKTSTGREIIRLYYEWSPVIVSAIEEDQEFKEELKELIDEMLPMIEEVVE